VIRAFGTQAYEEKKFDQVNREKTRVTFFINVLMSLQWPVIWLIMNSSIVLIIWVGAH